MIINLSHNLKIANKKFENTELLAQWTIHVVNTDSDTLICLCVLLLPSAPVTEVFFECAEVFFSSARIKIRNILLIVLHTKIRERPVICKYKQLTIDYER